MAIENGELKHECSPEHFHIGTARLKYHNETVSKHLERSTADTKKISPVRSVCRAQSRQLLITVSLKVQTPDLQCDYKAVTSILSKKQNATSKKRSLKFLFQ